jgi:hypothetical protein
MNKSVEKKRLKRNSWAAEIKPERVREQKKQQNEEKTRRNIQKKAPHDDRVCVRARLMHKVLSEVVGLNAV